MSIKTESILLLSPDLYLVGCFIISAGTLIPQLIRIVLVNNWSWWPNLSVTWSWSLIGLDGLELHGHCRARHSWSSHVLTSAVPFGPRYLSRHTYRIIPFLRSLGSSSTARYSGQKCSPVWERVMSSLGKNQDQVMSPLGTAPACWNHCPLLWISF